MALVQLHIFYTCLVCCWVVTTEGVDVFYWGGPYPYSDCSCLAGTGTGDECSCCCGCSWRLLSWNRRLFASAVSVPFRFLELHKSQVRPGGLTWNLQIFRKENDLPNLHDYVPCISLEVYFNNSLTFFLGWHCEAWGEVFSKWQFIYFKFPQLFCSLESILTEIFLGL